MELDRIYNETCLETLARMPDGFLNCVVTSPPYFGLRDYGTPGQIGLETTPAEYVAKMVAIFEEVRRVLRPDGTVWLNLGDSYSGGTTGRNDKLNGGGLYGGKQNGWDEVMTRNRNIPSGLKQKDILGMPWRVAFALQAAGWYLRQDIIWAKPNPMPESVTDRCTKAHEYIFLLTKSARYFYDAEAIKERSIHYGIDARSDMGNIQYRNGKRNGAAGTGQHSFVTIEENRNKRSVWTVSTQPFSECHFATFPPKLIEPCILAGCPAGGVVYDPFMGAGTTAMVAHKLGRQFIGSEINAEYVEMANQRLAPHLAQGGLF